jgi:formylglycine-generating enzyme required for sulfatase activity
MKLSSSLLCELVEARRVTDELFGIVRADALYERPIPERHRLIFYLGHVEAFDWNLLGRYELDRPAFQPEFDRLFAFGIDPPPGELPQDRPSDWPALHHVERYNARVRDEIDELADQVPESLLHVAIEHRLMHAETLAYLLHNLAYGRKVGPPVRVPPEPAEAPEQMMIEISAGEAELGMEPEDGFGWDNEFRRHVVHVPAFEVSRYKVTNGEYLEYVNRGGEVPFFWVEREGEWRYRGMFREMPLPRHHPVYVTHRQASEFARWKGMKLPSEPQFHRAAGDELPAQGNFDFRQWDPVAVHALPASDHRPAQMFGNGWEWTSTEFAPFPGFKPFPFYLNYSEPFFDGSHFVLKGASPRTAARMVRPSFRNWFRPDYPYIYSTFRLVNE